MGRTSLMLLAIERQLWGWCDKDPGRSRKWDAVPGCLAQTVPRTRLWSATVLGCSWTSKRIVSMPEQPFPAPGLPTGARPQSCMHWLGGYFSAQLLPASERSLRELLRALRLRPSPLA